MKVLKVHANPPPHYADLDKLNAGSMSIRQTRPSRVGEPGKYWIQNGDGEGLETSESKIEAMLAEFFRREF
jgi:hypothetical protein